MDESKPKDPLPKTFAGIKEAAEFWDTHSLDDYWEQTRPAEIQVRAVRRHRVTLASELFKQLMQISQQEGVSVETLVNLWIAERLQTNP